MTSDQPELVRRAVSGDLDALSDLLAVHGPQVERRLTVSRRFRDSIEPADVMQVTYLEAFLEIHRFDAARPASFEPWLQRLAENNLRDAIRGLERLKRPPPERRVQDAPPGAEDSRDQLLETLAVTTTTPSRSMRRDEAHALLERAIERLPHDYAAVIRACDLQGMPVDAVARSLARSPGAVFMLRARALERLGALIGSAAHA